MAEERARLSMADATVHIHWPRVDFEKWQALGNDYLIVERDALPFELTAGPDPQAVRRPHRRVRRRRAAPVRARAARLRRPPADLQPRRLRGRAVGQRRPRGGPVPAPRGWTDHDRFSIQTAAGEIRPDDHLGHDLPLWTSGRARRAQRRLPVGRADGVGRAERRRSRRGAFSTSRSAIPQCAIRVDGEEELEALDLPAIGPEIERHELFPNRTNVSWYTPLEPRPDPGPDLRARGGGDLGQRHRRHRRRRGPRARAAATRR